MHIVSAIVNKADTVVITVDCTSLRCLMYVFLCGAPRQLSRSIRCAGSQRGQVASLNNYYLPHRDVDVLSHAIWVFVLYHRQLCALSLADRRSSAVGSRAELEVCAVQEIQLA